MNQLLRQVVVFACVWRALSITCNAEGVSKNPKSLSAALSEQETNANQIVFYGRVVDQYSNSVEDVVVTFNAPQPTGFLREQARSNTMRTDKDGFFEVSERTWKIKGLLLRIVNISKEGYEFKSSGMNTLFQYDKVLTKCHKPDKNRPILYLIRKKESEQSVLIERNNVSFNFKSNGSSNIRGFDFLESQFTGNISRNNNSVKSPYCDLQAEASLNTNTATWTVTLRACGTNDGVIVSDKKLYVAPTNGYMREYSFALEDHKTPEKKFIYVSSRNGAIYTRLEIYSVGAMDASAWITAMSTTNPFGDPNLEPATDVPSGLIVQMRKEIRDSFRNDKRPTRPDLPRRIKTFEEKRAKEKER